MQRFLRILLCGLFAFTGSQVAYAQDYSGFYAGLNLGGSYTKATANQALFSPLCAAGGGGGGNGCKLQQGAINSIAPSLNEGSFTGGGQIGYNWRSGILVVGLEADLNYVKFGRSETSSVTWVTNNGGQKTIVSTHGFDSNNYVATVRPRIGLVSLNNSLLYVTGGWAFSDLSFSNNSTVYNQGGGGPNLPIHAIWNGSSSKNVGYVWGAGFEYPLLQGVTLKIEFQHLSFDMPDFVSVNSTSLGGNFALTNATLTSTPRFSADILRFGMNWRLN
jgi:outer membrane immunogenic protein